MRSVLVIGGTGAQGSAVIRVLSKAGNYSITALTRSTSSKAAVSIGSLPNVALVEGNTYHEPTLRSALKGVDSAFINTNGFAIGEKAEIHWGIRIYELAREAGVRHFVWGSLDYALKKGKYDPRFRCSHYDGKSKVAEFILAQPTEPMAFTVLASGPYMESLSELYRPTVDSSGTYVFAAPLDDGALPLIHLDDLGAYVLWILENPAKSNGMNLEISTEHVTWKDLARTFTVVTGKPAKYKPLTWAEYFGGTRHTGRADDKLGHSTDKEDSTLMTYRENFTGFWNIWRATGQNQGLITRDYAFLDEILPSRIKTLGEWMRKVNYTGEAVPVLKDVADKMESDLDKSLAK